MRPTLFLFSLFGALALAEECQCPQVKCPSDDAVKLCQCINGRESKCAARCPDYVPKFLPCPINPPTATPTKPAPSLITKTLVNPAPSLITKTLVNPVPSLITKTLVNPAPTFITLTLSNPAPTTTPPKPGHAVCGGGRGNYKPCDQGFLCMKDPFQPGCGPECDGFGICVEDKLCGGFGGFACKEKAQVCVDDPRDDCDPKEGGSDCGGLCVWKSG